ncbi:MAG: flavin reductase [Pirellulales bacterium]
MSTSAARPLNVTLDVAHPIWDRFFTVAPLVVVGSQESDGRYNLAPKHMAMPVGWQNYFGFVCSPRHTTYHNIQRTREFTVSYLRPSQSLLATLAAAPRCEDHSKPSLLVLPTLPARQVNGVLVQDAYVGLECTLHSIVDGFGANSLIIGTIVAARASEDALRADDRDENEQLYEHPLLAYLHPGRMAEVRGTNAFPFPKDFAR